MMKFPKGTTLDLLITDANSSEASSGAEGDDDDDDETTGKVYRAVVQWRSTLVSHRVTKLQICG